ncbi:MAG: exo-alpha-sialidase [Bacteroidetes bacterium]|nr:MAG: exo-alpha-sialidase [Bacteroidota bacterium]
MQLFIYQKTSLIICTLLLLHTTFLPAQAVVNWSDPIPVAPSGLGTASPRLVLDDTGNPMILWGQGGSTPTIRLARWSNGSFSTPVEVGTGNRTPGIYDFGGLDLAVHQDTVYVVFEHIMPGIYLARSVDGGQTFEDPVAVFTPGAGKIVTLPSVAADNAGNPMVSYLYEAGNESDAVYHLARSADAGASFLPPVVASAPADGDYVCECCPSDIISAGDSVWLAFRSLRPGNIRDIWISRSTDGGDTFDVAADVDDTDWVLSVCPTSAPRSTLSGDSLVTVWMSRGTGTTRIHGSTLGTDTGKASSSFTFPIVSPFGTQIRPDIAGQADTIGVVWEETGIPVNGTEIMFAFSAQGAASLPVQISNLTNIPGTQKVPALAYQQGAFHVVYADVQSGQLWYRKGIVTAASAVSGPNPVADLDVFPNPARAEIQLNWPAAIFSTLDFRLIQTDGRICRRWSGVQPGQQLSVTGLAPGTYYLHGSWNGQPVFQKTVVRTP